MHLYHSLYTCVVTTCMWSTVMVYGLPHAAGVHNLHVSTVVDPTSGRLTMLYQIKEGACDQSFGIQVRDQSLT